MLLDFETQRDPLSISLNKKNRRMQWNNLEVIFIDREKQFYYSSFGEELKNRTDITSYVRVSI